MLRAQGYGQGGVGGFRPITAAGAAHAGTGRPAVPARTDMHQVHGASKHDADVCKPDGQLGEARGSDPGNMW